MVLYTNHLWYTVSLSLVLTLSISYIYVNFINFLARLIVFSAVQTSKFLLCVKSDANCFRVPFLCVMDFENYNVLYWTGFLTPHTNQCFYSDTSRPLAILQLISFSFSDWTKNVVLKILCIRTRSCKRIIFQPVSILNSVHLLWANGVSVWVFYLIRIRIIRS